MEGHGTDKQRIDLRRVGASLVMFSVEAGADEFGVSVPRFLEALRSLSIPTVQIGDVSYFNLFTLEQTLFAALRPGRTSFVFGAPPPGYKPEKCQRLSHWYEIGLAALTYSYASERMLRARIRSVAKALYRKTVKREVGTKTVEKGTDNGST